MSMYIVAVEGQEEEAMFSSLMQANACVRQWLELDYNAIIIEVWI